ncbi:MAG: preprotein translocase subunit YajC [Acidimicrobiales bacterium]
MLPVLILTIVLIVPFWALIIRPQQQRQREHRAFVETLAPGDRIESFSGIHGTVADVGDDTVQVEVAPDVVITMAKLAVSSRLAGPDPTRAEDPVTTSDPRPTTTSGDLEEGAS